jgi:hypothetical protein
VRHVLAYYDTLVRKSVYLNKLDPKLNSLWNYLDRECRGGLGTEETTDVDCDQRLTVDAIIKSKGGPWKRLPGPGPSDFLLAVQKVT